MVCGKNVQSYAIDTNFGTHNVTSCFSCGILIKTTGIVQIEMKFSWIDLKQQHRIAEVLFFVLLIQKFKVRLIIKSLDTLLNNCWNDNTKYTHFSNFALVQNSTDMI